MISGDLYGDPSRRTILFPLPNASGPDKGWERSCKAIESRFGLTPVTRKIDRDALKTAQGVILVDPCESLTKDQIAGIKEALRFGQIFLWIFSSDPQHVQAFLEDYEIEFNPDDVLAVKEDSVEAHPAEAIIEDSKFGVPSLVEDSLSWIYPFGKSLRCGTSVKVLATSGSTSFPAHYPVLSRLYSDHIMVCGSGQIFSDDYIAKYDNMRLLIGLMAFTLEELDHRGYESTCDKALTKTKDYNYLSDIATMANYPITPFASNEPIGSDLRSYIVDQTVNFEACLEM